MRFPLGTAKKGKKHHFLAFLYVCSKGAKIVQNGQKIIFFTVLKNRHQNLSNALYRAKFWQKLAEIHHFQFWPFFWDFQKKIDFLAILDISFVFYKPKWPKWQKNRFFWKSQKMVKIENDLSQQVPISKWPISAV